MDSQFWINAWDEGRTGFHQEKFNEKLLEYFPSFHPQPGQKVLVPLCGKTRDMLWLHSQKLQVHGVELYEEPVKAFFSDNKLPEPKISRDQHFVSYSLENLLLSSGDFFKLDSTATYDLVYDRAALVALPSSMRQAYAKKIAQLTKKGGKCLLIAYEYKEGDLEGPPFSVFEKEIHDLYQESFSIKQVEAKKPTNENNRLTSAPSLTQPVYVLERK